MGMLPVARPGEGTKSIMVAIKACPFVTLTTPHTLLEIYRDQAEVADQLLDECSVPHV
jgi:hypothetical protein